METGGEVVGLGLGVVLVGLGAGFVVDGGGVVVGDGGGVLRGRCRRFGDAVILGSPIRGDSHDKGACARCAVSLLGLARVGAPAADSPATHDATAAITAIRLRRGRRSLGCRCAGSRRSVCRSGCRPFGCALCRGPGRPDWDGSISASASVLVCDRTPGRRVFAAFVTECRLTHVFLFSLPLRAWLPPLRPPVRPATVANRTNGTFAGPKCTVSRSWWREPKAPPPGTGATLSGCWLGSAAADTYRCTRVVVAVSARRALRLLGHRDRTIRVMCGMSEPVSLTVTARIVAFAHCPLRRWISRRFGQRLVCRCRPRRCRWRSAGLRAWR
jgi:hypothetical protein